MHRREGGRGIYGWSKSSIKNKRIKGWKDEKTTQTIKNNLKKTIK